MVRFADKTSAAKRASALLLLVFFLLPVLALCVTSSSGDDASLPICCRRGGKHKCSMGRMGAVAGQQAEHATSVFVSERCPFQGHSLSQHATADYGSPDSTVWDAPVAIAQFTVRFANIPPTREITYEHPKRGPPVASDISLSTEI